MGKIVVSTAKKNAKLFMYYLLKKAKVLQVVKIQLSYLFNARR